MSHVPYPVRSIPGNDVERWILVAGCAASSKGPVTGKSTMASTKPASTTETDEIEDEKEGVTQSLPPSHILEDGRFIYLPPPNTFERSKFFERSIARHGLLEADMMGRKQETKSEDPDDEEEKNDDSTAPKVHPLAVASARLQANGLAELNRAINLAGLVTSGDYFGLSTIVDPSLEVESATASKEDAVVKPVSDDMQEEQKVKSAYVLKRKRAQFEQASAFLERHEKRLKAAVAAQSVVDRRLCELRRQWRLVAPEHGTRARLHATRPTEVVAIDVDVYDRDRVGGGNQALIGSKPSLAGRLASRVPRYATIELKDDYKVDLKELETQQQMELDKPDETDSKETDRWTRAEPFAVADPTLGKVADDFDPKKVPMLTLQLDIQKSSTGFKMSECLSPMTTLSVAQDEKTTYAADEQLLVSLQHSLFCASLFESMRSELDPEPPSNTIGTVTSKPQVVVWLSCESEENFLPPPSVLAGGDSGRGVAPLSVIHCHEGEVKVQLDAEYTLCVKLVEASLRENETNNADHNQNKDSGSQTPPQLHALCRALLLHAQDVYHNHSLYLRAHAKMKQEEEAAKGDGPRGLARIKKEDVLKKPCILQSSVSLGSKMLFEKRIRKSLKRVCNWLKSVTSETLAVEWLALSIFDLQSQFTLCFRQLVLDVNIVRDVMTVTRITGEEHHKVKFHTDDEFELFLKLELRRCLRNS